MAFFVNLLAAFLTLLAIGFYAAYWFVTKIYGELRVAAWLCVCV